MVGSEWARKILGLNLHILARVSIWWSLGTRGAWLAWLWNEGDKEFVDPDMMNDGGFDSVDWGEGTLWSKSLGFMGEDELINSLSCGK